MIINFDNKFEVTYCPVEINEEEEAKRLGLSNYIISNEEFSENQYRFFNSLELKDKKIICNLDYDFWWKYVIKKKIIQQDNFNYVFK